MFNHELFPPILYHNQHFADISPMVTNTSLLLSPQNIFLVVCLFVHLSSSLYVIRQLFSVIHQAHCTQIILQWKYRKSFLLHSIIAMCVWLFVCVFFVFENDEK